MKKIIILLVSILSVSATSFAKSKNLTVNQYNLFFSKIDSSVVGTWEKDWNLKQKSNYEFCQFNANGTFISFKKINNKYVVTGRGKWIAENEEMVIIHGEEKSVSVKYSVQENQLIFNGQVSYSKPALTYANK